MRILLSALAAVIAIGVIDASTHDAAAECRMEKQCRWKDFKKECVWVKVCR
jgi:hypothetical protein